MVSAGVASVGRGGGCVGRGDSEGGAPLAGGGRCDERRVGSGLKSDVAVRTLRYLPRNLVRKGSYDAPDKCARLLPPFGILIPGSAPPQNKSVRKSVYGVKFQPPVTAVNGAAPKATV